MALDKFVKRALGQKEKEVIVADPEVVRQRDELLKANLAMARELDAAKDALSAALARRAELARAGQESNDTDVEIAQLRTKTAELESRVKAHLPELLSKGADMATSNISAPILNAETQAQADKRKADAVALQQAIDAARQIEETNAVEQNNQSPVVESKKQVDEVKAAAPQEDQTGSPPAETSTAGGDPAPTTDSTIPAQGSLKTKNADDGVNKEADASSSATTQVATESKDISDSGQKMVKETVAASGANAIVQPRKLRDEGRAAPAPLERTRIERTETSSFENSEIKQLLDSIQPHLKRFDTFLDDDKISVKDKYQVERDILLIEGLIGDAEYTAIENAKGVLTKLLSILEQYKLTDK